MPVSIICPICKINFSVPPSQGNQKYCSSKCYGVAQRGRNICSIDGCKKFVRGRGMCNAHYLRLIRHGDPLYENKRRAELSRCLYCGEEAPHKSSGAKYCSWVCVGMANRSPFILKKGYKKILVPSHPRSDTKGYVFEHIIIAEAKNGRPLSSGEVVHHIDGNKLNNAAANLMIFASNAEHLNHHSAIQSGKHH